ncbi:hypothetical protein HC256_007580 [Beauveria bassiana]|nr:hypothetical protein HC256_007580 [Beauveria bassiana]
MSFARSLNKAQGFLMPYRRPTFGRTLSNSSELSLTSNTSGRDEDVGGDAVPSAPGTPVLAPTENPFFAKPISRLGRVPISDHLETQLMRLDRASAHVISIAAVTVLLLFSTPAVPFFVYITR